MEGFLVGFGRVDSTPLEPVPLAGFGRTSHRFFKSIRDQLYATCVAVTDEAGSTVLLFHMDVISLCFKAQQTVRQAIVDKTGIPWERIYMCCTHTHSGPDTHNREEESILRYTDYLADRAAKAAALALADREEGRLYYGSIECPNMNFVKHYKNVTAEGETKFFGDNFGEEVLDETTRHATDADQTMHLLKFVRPGCKDIVMANWRAHAMLTSGRKKFDLSADFPGDFRDAMEEQEDCLFAFYQGAAGNINPYSRVMEEDITRESYSYGRKLAEFAREGLKNMTLARSGAVKTAQTILDGEVDHSRDGDIEVARRISKLWYDTGDFSLVVREGRPYNIRSPYNAGAIIMRYGGPATHDLELNAIALGPDVALVTAPNELFDTISVMTEEASEFPITLTLGYCNVYLGYIPSKFGYEYTCYESDCTWFVPGTGEQIAAEFIKMLKKLKGA